MPELVEFKITTLPAVRAIIAAAVALLNEVDATPDDFVSPAIQRQADDLRAAFEEWIV